MDLHTEMYEPYLMQVAVLVHKLLLEHWMEMGPYWLDGQDYSGD